MRILIIIKKCIRQQVRDRIGLALSLLTVPFFVFFYWILFSDQGSSLKILICNNDVSISTEEGLINYGEKIVNNLQNFSIRDNIRNFDVKMVKNSTELKAQLFKREGVAGVVIPHNFSDSLVRKDSGSSVFTLSGDSTNISYYVVKAFISKILEEYNNKKSKIIPSIIIEEKQIGLSSQRTPFELYVPGLLVFAVIMLIFSSSMAVAREIESHTLDRLRMSPVTSFSLLTGISTVQIIQGLISVLLTFMVACILGFRSAGSIGFAFLISSITCFASVGIGMVVASISRNQTRAFLISSVAMFMLILFSGIIFPRPEITLFNIGNYSIKLFDFLPTTHMGKGLEKLLTFGAEPVDLVFEVSFLVFLSFFYYGIGVFSFNRFSMSRIR